MGRLKQRVDDLERGSTGLQAVTRWHWVLGEPGETLEQARARYEREVEPVGATEGVIFWRTAEPTQVPA